MNPLGADTEQRRHGTLACYQAGCRRDECRGAMSLHAKKYRVRVSREGPTLVDVAGVRAAVDYARAAGITWRDMGRATGVNFEQIEKLGRSPRITRRLRDDILTGLAALVAERLSALEDCQSSIRAATVRHAPKRLLPTRPLLDAIEYRWPAEERLRRGFGLNTWLEDKDRKYLNRSATIDEDRAERICRALGLFPEDVWGPTWFGDVYPALDDTEGAA